MKIQNVLNLLEQYAPLSLSNEFCQRYDAYDNSGIIVKIDEDITGIVFSLDLTSKAVNTAIEKGYNLIVTHHPAIYKGIKSVDSGDALYKAISNGIGVISMHLNLDCAKLGIDYYLAKGLGAKTQTVLMPVGDYGYGRTFEVDATLSQIIENYIKTFDSDKVFVYGDKDAKIKKISSFCGAGFSEYEYQLSKDSDLIISSDVPHHMILKVLESGRNLMQITHYASEAYGFSKFYQSVQFENKIFVKEKNM